MSDKPAKSDKPANGEGKAADNAQQQKPPMVINGQYIKDLSFESPNSPVILTELQNQKPDISVNVNIATAKIEGAGTPASLYEVVLDLQATLKLGDKTGFVIELKYGGVFTLNVPEDRHQAFLMIECPRILFPFARQIISDTTQGGGFMPLMLQPIDFAGMYHANVTNEMNAADAEVSQIIADKK